jgi:hypothetical protein
LTLEHALLIREMYRKAFLRWRRFALAPEHAKRDSVERGLWWWSQRQSAIPGHLWPQISFWARP